MQNITSRSWLLPPQIKKKSYIDVKSSSASLLSFALSKTTKKLMCLVPLMALLVGSCKTTELTSLAPVAFDIPQKVVVALLPQKTLIAGNEQRPNRGHIYRAQNIVTKDPQKLADLTLQEVSYIFGEPTFSRKDADARVWQYKTSSCVIDFYFYKDDKKTSTDSVSFVDMRFKEELIPGASSRTSPASNQEKSGCLTDVVAARSYKKSKA